MTTWCDEYSLVMSLENHKIDRKVSVYLGEVTEQYLVDVTEKGEWYEAECMTQNYEEALKAATELFVNGPPKDK
jgi:hypothetical protein